MVKTFLTQIVRKTANVIRNVRMEDKLNVYVLVDRPNTLRPKILAGTNIWNQYISTGCYSDSYDARAVITTVRLIWPLTRAR